MENTERSREAMDRMPGSPRPLFPTPAPLPPHHLPLAPAAWPRRRFVQAGAAMLAAAVAEPSVGVPHLRRFAVARPAVRRRGPALPMRALEGDDPALVALTQRAVEAARVAGASYADARLTHVRSRTFSWSPSEGATETEVCHVGVRALVNGYWGFAACPYWVPETVAWLGRTAVQQATANAGGPAGVTALAPASHVADGRWATPLVADPFALPVAEAWDRFGGIVQYCRQYLLPSTPGRIEWGVNSSLSCWREHSVFASSEGSTYTQTRTRATPFLEVSHFDTVHETSVATPAPFLTEAAGGFEAAFDERRIFAWVPKAVEELQRLAKLPLRPVQVGRYDMVWDASSVASFLGASLGTVTQVDRILGYEANAGGTSYLGADPLAVLGAQVGAKLITVTADRTRVGGLATVGWDAEGVAPDPYLLVKEGVLVDLQATRAQAAALAPYYQKASLPAKSKGGADADGAGMVPLTHTPNLVLHPGAEEKTFDQLVAGLTNGLVLRRATFAMDFQAATGFGQGDIYQVKNGKIVAQLYNAAVLMHSSEVWKRVTALGGAGSVEAVPLRSTKGEPQQQTAYTVWAVPACLKEVTVIDATRRGS